MSDPADAAPSAPSNAATSSGPASTRHCSECGWGTPSHKPHTPLWPKLVVWIVPLVVVALWLAYSITRKPNGFGFANTSCGVGFVEPFITREHLRELATDEPPRSSHKQIATRIPDGYKSWHVPVADRRFRAALLPFDSGKHVRSASLGFPFWWLSIAHARDYKHVRTLEGPIAARTEPNGPHFSGFFLSPFGLMWQPEPERTGGARVSMNVEFVTLFASASVATLAVFIGARVVLHPRAPKMLRTSTTWRRAILGVVFIGIMLGPQIASRKHPDSSTWMNDRGTRPGVILDSPSLSELRALPAQSRDQALARGILAACGDAPDADPDDILLAGICDEYCNSYVQSKDFSFIAHSGPLTLKRCIDRDSAGPATAQPSFGIRARLESIKLVSPGSTKQTPAHYVHLRIPAIVAVASACLLPGLIPFLLHRRFTRRRAAKRERKSLCPSCGYPLPVLQTS